MPFRKPDVRHLLTALEQLCASPNESVMIGDNENDYVAARAAGVAVILMRYGYLRVPLETLAPDAWLDRFRRHPAGARPDQEVKTFLTDIAASGARFRTYSAAN